MLKAYWVPDIWEQIGVNERVQLKHLKRENGQGGCEREYVNDILDHYAHVILMEMSMNEDCQ